MTATTNSPYDDDDRGAGYGDKLIPEWRVDADDQVLVAGLAVIAAMLLAFGWSIRGSDDGGISTVGSTIVDEITSLEAAGPMPVGPTVVSDDDDDGADDELDGQAEDEAADVTTGSSTTSSVAPTSSTAPEPGSGDVQAAVDSFPGDITGSIDGTTVALTGFVANDAEGSDVEAAALAVEGVEAVDNRLVVLEPLVVEALEAAGVTGAGAVGIGTEISVDGTIDTEDLRQPTLDTAAAVPGVSSIVDNRLDVSVTADLNELPQVRFATGSARILDVSNADLDAAVELLSNADPAVRIEIQGYTDVRGDDDANLELSQARAEAVRSQLVDAGVSEDMLSAVGYGETTLFASGDTPEAYQANRLVRFQQTD